VNKTAASAVQLVKCILLHAYIHVQLLAPDVPAQTKTSYSLLNKLAFTWFGL